jgi:broad specificity phosphatase PhoE
MRTIIIARHGNTFESHQTPTRVGRRTDLDLTATGLVQAQAIGRWLLDQGLQVDTAYCSPLKRTRQTAQAALHTAYGTDAPAIQTLDFLNEIDYGVDENKPESDVIARIGAEAIQKWDHDGIAPMGWDVDPNKIIRNWQDFFKDCPENHTIFAVTSNGTARFIPDALHIPVSNRKLKTGATAWFEDLGTGWTLKSWNL